MAPTGAASSGITHSVVIIAGVSVGGVAVALFLFLAFALWNRYRCTRKIESSGLEFHAPISRWDRSLNGQGNPLERYKFSERGKKKPNLEQPFVSVSLSCCPSREAPAGSSSCLRPILSENALEWSSITTSSRDSNVVRDDCVAAQGRTHVVSGDKISFEHMINWESYDNTVEPISLPAKENKTPATSTASLCGGDHGAMLVDSVYAAEDARCIKARRTILPLYEYPTELPCHRSTRLAATQCIIPTASTGVHRWEDTATNGMTSLVPLEDINDFFSNEGRCVADTDTVSRTADDTGDGGSNFWNWLDPTLASREVSGGECIEYFTPIGLQNYEGVRPPAKVLHSSSDKTDFLQSFGGDHGERENGRQALQTLGPHERFPAPRCGITEDALPNMPGDPVMTSTIPGHIFDEVFSSHSYSPSSSPAFSIPKTLTTAPSDSDLDPTLTNKDFQFSDSVNPPAPLQRVHTEKAVSSNKHFQSGMDSASPCEGVYSKQRLQGAAPASSAPLHQRLRCKHDQCNKTFARQYELKYVLSNS